MELSPPQRAAAERLGQDVCVVAGPGSGKTRVLTDRFCWLVREKRISPDRILAITFTEKATTNIKQRLVGEFAGDPMLRQQIERAYVSTIHGFCMRLLRENAVAATVDVDFQIMDDSVSRPLLEYEAHRVLDSLFVEKRTEMRSILEALYASNSPVGQQKDLAGALISVYDAIRVSGESVNDIDSSIPETALGLIDVVRAVLDLTSLPGEWETANRKRIRDQLREWVAGARTVAAQQESLWHFQALAGLSFSRRGLSKATAPEGKRIVEELIPAVRCHLVTRHFEPLRALLLEALQRIETGFRAAKQERASLDFSDLEESTLHLLQRRPDIRERVSSRFEYILMDELQDTNRLQWRILDSIRRPNRFFAVGDINQSIYGFRHADPAVFAGYRDQLRKEDKQVDELDENYRSRREILDAVDAIAGSCPGVEHRRLKAKSLLNRKPPIGPVVEIAGLRGQDSEEAAQFEARWIAHRIRQLEPEVPGDLRRFAILCRTREPLKLIERTLHEAGIPGLLVGGRTLYESREVRDLVHIVSVLANPLDEVSLAGALRSPFVGVRDETLLRLKLRGDLWAGIVAMDTFDTDPFPPEDADRLRWFRGRITYLRENRNALSPDRSLALLVDESGYEDHLDAHGRGNVEKFLARLRELHQDRPRTLFELLADLAGLRQSASEAEAPPGKASNAVRLMTIHAAKGLEFPVVFVAAMQRGGASAVDPVCYSPEHGFGVKWRDPVSDDGAGDVIYTSISDELGRKNAAESDRLLYVAMTRAEERLILTHATHARAPKRGFVVSVANALGFEDDGADCDELIRLPDSDTPVRVVFAGEVAAPAFSPIGGEPPEPEEIADPPDPGPQRDSVIPVTEASTFAACPRRYYLAHYLGYRAAGGDIVPAAGDEPPAPWDDGDAGAGGAGLGTQVHRLLAGGVVESPDREAVDLVARFEASDLARRIREASTLEREFDFVMDLEGVLLRGQIDLWFRRDSELVLVDYKTDRFDPERDPNRLRPYEFQLRLYGLALQRHTGRLPTEAILYFLRHDRQIRVSLDEDILQEVRDEIQALARAQDEIRFPLREGPECRACEFFGGHCPAGTVEKGLAGISLL